MDFIFRVFVGVVLPVFLATGASAQFASTNAGTPGASAFEPSTDRIENGGLGVRILFVGRNADGKSLTVSTELTNVTEEPVYIALVGPAPAAIDTQGVTYELKSYAGLASCRTLANDAISPCITGYGNYLPGESFSVLQPNASSIVGLTFSADQASTSGLLSVTLNVALAQGTRPSNKRGDNHNIENVAISFPLVPLEENK